MPLYKFFGNKVLSTFENAVAGTALSEWHSGYRAYSVDALRDLRLDQMSDGFDFDTQIILQLVETGKRIVEIPIPTFYGDEICYVNGLKYARDVTRSVVRYRAHKMGFGSGETAFASDPYELKHGEDTSHARILHWVSRMPPGRVLDLGCSDGRLGERMRLAGHEVTGVDLRKHDGVGERLDRFVEADLDRGLPPEAGDGYDLVVAADVLEHVRAPANLLDEIRGRLAPRGVVITSVPNFGHWYPRVRVAAGRFDYDRRGILDTGHLRFFTRRSFERLATEAGFEVRRSDSVGLPIEVGQRGGASGDRAPSGGARLAEAADRLAAELWPSMFAYQFVYELAAADDR
jgi:SAM-dependent methyltransferase